MRIAYVNSYYNADDPGGGNAHIGQFIANTAALGHELWADRRVHHEAVRTLPSGRFDLLRVLRSMDVIYMRVESYAPRISRWAVLPYRKLLGDPAIVWEFNTVPEFGLLSGRPQQEVDDAISSLRQYGQGCDLAVCVSSALSDYVHNRLGIKRVITVSNGSDPALFRPDIPQVRRMAAYESELRVVWIGSAHLKWNNFTLLRHAAEQLWNSGVNDQVSFHIIGSRLDVLGDMPPNVHYYGPVRYDSLPGWLSAMDVGLILYHEGPSDYGSSLKLFDYMASGLAVVATRQPQVQDVFAELDQSDLMLDRDDPEQLAKTLLALAADRRRVERQGALGRELVIRKYNWKMLVSRIMSTIEEMINA